MIISPYVAIQLTETETEDAGNAFVCCKSCAEELVEVGASRAVHRYAGSMAARQLHMMESDPDGVPYTLLTAAEVDPGFHCETDNCPCIWDGERWQLDYEWPPDGGFYIAIPLPGNEGNAFTRGASPDSEVTR